MKKIAIIIAVLGMLFASIYFIAKDNLFLQHRVYTILEQQTLNEDEKEIVMSATDPDIMRDGYVVLDEKHAKLFEQHFGHKR